MTSPSGLVSARARGRAPCSPSSTGQRLPISTTARPPASLDHRCRGLFGTARVYSFHNARGAVGDTQRDRSFPAMKVIVADDDVVTRMLMVSVVEGLGHECVPASTGTAALEAYDKFGADVIVTDWLMPGLDGLELCRQVRLYTDRRYAYVVVVSGRSDRADVLSGMRAGADGYLSKPIHFEELEMQLNAAARVTELHRRLSEKQQIMDEELERAAEVQRRLLPRRVPDVPGYDIAGGCVPSWSVSGEFFDWYPMPCGVV